MAMELECLAMVFACQRFDQYIYGRKVTVETDHRVLEIITKKSLLAAPKCLQCMLLALQHYNLEVRYRPGVTQHIADALSRAPVDRPKAEQLGKEEVFLMSLADTTEEEIEHCTSRQQVHVSDERMGAVKREAAHDDEQQRLRQMVCQGWPAKVAEVPLEIMILELHSSHQGYEATLRRARDAVYWPGMADQIKSLTASCTICEKDAPAQPNERLLAHEIPKQPWAKVGMDLFKCKGKDYLVIVDYLTDFFEISELSDTTSATVIKATKKEFTRHGVPLMVQSDGGPQFTSSEFQSFAKTWEFQHTTSSPYNSRSNGKAESAVKIAKRLLKRSQDPYRALLEWRNTPTAGLGSSPAQRLLARRTRAAVPTNPKKLKAAPQPQMWEKKVERQRKM